ncbi:ornithine--oxo-acid transaminase [Streptomyces sulfonofaciens]|uniref:ornithine aminotransferase n=1 Tax=Streptomyces sulfonofaciens TaxID=68272 RepID=A0A919L7A6_9ACTN|nr:ornithine--oxo-acid transaminase [Streptomyces sulfonofaciens]GHH86034.1 ornithine--oxo-acid transaminase [Streptomyces sulfonofaciens]
MSLTHDEITRADASVAHNYHPLPVVITRGEGAWVTDVEGRRLLDMLSGYSALNFGHGDKDLLGVAHAQLDRLTLTSRAFHHDGLATFCAELAELAGMEMVLPMNTGAEAVETAVKTARKWGYRVKGVPDGRAKIVVMGGNFHGRTLTIVSFSDDPDATADYGPFTPGFVRVPFGDIAAARAAVDEDTVAVLVEPVQGEGGVILPPPGYLRQIRQLCTERNVLMIADEIQSGLGRTGRTFACDHEDVVPDVYVLGKALGGGIVPVSAVVSRADVLGVFRPGEHGSTFGGNPLACAVGTAVVRRLRDGSVQQRATELGAVFAGLLSELPGGAVAAVRSLGLWAGIDLRERTGRDVCEGLLRRGVLSKDAHGRTLRLAPPLVVAEADLRWGMARLAEELAQGPEAA